MIFMWVLLAICIGIIIYFLVKKPKETIKYIERDIDAEKKAQFEAKYRQKEAELNNFIEEKRKEKMGELEKQYSELIAKHRDRESILTAEFEIKKQNMIKGFEEEVELRKKRNKELKEKLVEWIKTEESKAAEEVNEIKNFIESWKSKQDAVVESFKKLDELKNAESFYRIVLSPEEREELIELNKAIKKLRNPLPFRKAVYSIYYQPKINELVLRVVGSGKVSGVYKITHIESGKVYIGQSVNIGNRWKQHARRGAGAESLTANKLYPAMLEYGLESFQFEIVEIGNEDSNLNEMEKYWQDYFQAKEFGYSMK